MLPKRNLEKLKYKILPAVGPGSLSTEGSVADLLFDVPYFFLAKIMPPMDVVNEVLQKGVVDAGMSGCYKWKPFNSTAHPTAKLAADLRQMHFVTIQPPNIAQRTSPSRRTYRRGKGPSRRDVSFPEVADKLDSFCAT
jgi:hypothetical protein